MLKGRWEPENITEDKELIVKNCVALGVTNLGAATVFFDTVPLVPNATLTLGYGNVVIDQTFNVRFIGTGSKQCVVVKTILKADNEC